MRLSRRFTKKEFILLWCLLSFTLFAVDKNRYAEVGKIFSVRKNVVEVTGNGINRFGKGQKLIAATRSGDIYLTVLEVYHSKINCKVLGDAVSIQAGDLVFFPEKKSAETEAITVGESAEDNVKLYQQ